MYKLLGPDGKTYLSETPGVLGGNSQLKIYGRLDCWSANAALRKGGYRNCRVFFADEATAIAAGYRPCGHCLRDKYLAWKREQAPEPIPEPSEPSVPAQTWHWMEVEYLTPDKGNWTKKYRFQTAESGEAWALHYKGTELDPRDTSGRPLAGVDPGTRMVGFRWTDS